MPPFDGIIKKELKMAISNLAKFKDDLERLITEASLVKQSLKLHAFGQEYKDMILNTMKGDEERQKNFISKIKPFGTIYQHWYSESIVVVRQLIPDRLEYFIRLFEKPRARKEIDVDNYSIEDACQGLIITRVGGAIVDSKAVIPKFDQQVAILESSKRRFESLLFDIRQMMQADLFDSEIDAARELLKNKFIRAAGAVAGVVLERHLSQVCENHNITMTRKHPSIADYNQSLKDSDVIDTPQWRFHQHLADIRNKCDHSKSEDPTSDEVADMVNGVAKVVKTIF